MKNDSLFILIKSLNKNEKGYFKKNSRLYSTNKENNYLTLFDVIDKMEEYDEKELKLHLKGEKWIKHLPSLKSYLFTQILKNLEAYQNNGGKNEETFLAMADILIHRGLYAEALTMLKKGQATAEANENLHNVLHSLGREIIIVRALSPSQDISDKVAKIKQRRDTILTAMREYYDLMDRNDRIYRLCENTGTLRMEDVVRELDALIGPDYILKIERATSRRIKLVGYNTLTAYYALREDNESSFIYARKLFHLVGESSDFFNLQMVKVYVIVDNFLQTCLLTHRFDEFEKNIKYLENLKPQYGFSRAKKFYMLYHLYFTYLHSIDRPAEVYSYLPKFKRDFKLYESSLSSTEIIGMVKHISHLLFRNADIESAIDWNALAMEHEKKIERQDYRTCLRIQDLIFHYEISSYRLLDSKLLSAQRYLRKNNIYFKTEECIISYIRQLSKAEGRKKQLQIFREFKENYNSIMDQSPTERSFGEYFRLPEWIDRKISELAR